MQRVFSCNTRVNVFDFFPLAFGISSPSLPLPVPRRQVRHCVDTSTFPSYNPITCPLFHMPSAFERLEALHHPFSNTIVDSLRKSLVGLDQKYRPQLESTLNDCLSVYSLIGDTLEKKRTTIVGISETTLLNWLDDNSTIRKPRERMRPIGREIEQLATQYEHINQVLTTTVRLKRRLVEHELPNTIFAYQLGTGFPLPEENEYCKKVDYIPYQQANGPLEFFSRPGVPGHDNDSGMHVYKIKTKDGNESTLLALKGRSHGYEEIDTYMPHLTLTSMPRVLKGLDAQVMLATFASGVDPVSAKVLPFKVGDYGVILDTADQSGVDAQQHPGSGSQEIIGPVFGGPFLPDVKRLPPETLIRIFADKIRLASGDQDETAPNIYGTYVFDTMGMPNFQGPLAHAAARAVADKIQELETYPKSLLQLFDGEESIRFSTNFGMAIGPELACYFQNSLYGVPTRFNKVLPTLPVLTFTDLVDPRDHGGSQTVSHEVVLAQGARSASFIAPVIRDFFIDLTDNPPSNIVESLDEHFTEEIKDANLEQLPKSFDDVKAILTNQNVLFDKLSWLYQQWGFPDEARTQLAEKAYVQNILHTLDDDIEVAGRARQRVDKTYNRGDPVDQRPNNAYDYFVLLRDRHLGHTQYLNRYLDRWRDQPPTLDPDILSRYSEDEIMKTKKWHIRWAWRSELAARLSADKFKIDHSLASITELPDHTLEV